MRFYSILAFKERSVDTEDSHMYVDAYTVVQVIEVHLLFSSTESSCQES